MLDKTKQPTMSIQVVDDHEIVRDGLRCILGQRPDINMVAESANGQEAFAHYLQHNPDVVLLDISMPDESGLTTLQKIIEHDAGAKVVIFTMYADPLIAVKAIEFGAKGFVSKRSSPDAILQAIARVYSGGVYIENDVANEIVMQNTGPGHGLEKLSAREFEVFSLLSQGKTVREIAGLLNLSHKTVGVHRSHILEKLDCSNAVELSLLAMKQGILSGLLPK